MNHDHSSLEVFAEIGLPFLFSVMLPSDVVGQQSGLHLIVESPGLLEYLIAPRIKDNHDRAILFMVVAFYFRAIICGINASPESKIDLYNRKLFCIAFDYIRTAEHTDRVATASSVTVITEKYQHMPGRSRYCF